MRDILRTAPFELKHGLDLYRSLRRDDINELHLLGLTPSEALVHISADSFKDKTHSAAWAVVDREGVAKGCFGYNIPAPAVEGCIYSLWTAINAKQSRQVLEETPAWVALMLKAAKVERLWNIIPKTSRTSLRWLRLSRCFVINDKSSSLIRGQEVYTFHTKPLEELGNV